MKKNTRKKLALFDIDGTLITTRGMGVSHWQNSLHHAFKTVFSPLPEFDGRQFNGKLERQYFRELANILNISDSDFEQKFPDAIREFNKAFMSAIDSKEFEVLRIPGAFEAVSRLKSSPHTSIGLLTGNNEALAWHKMKAANFAEPFTFGLFGTETNHRGELVKRAKEKAKNHFGKEFAYEDMVVIGDTKFDIAAAKYAGAFALGVTTGITDTREDLLAAGADLVVDSLTDPGVEIILP